jgi:hypothetical protein
LNTLAVTETGDNPALLLDDDEPLDGSPPGEDADAYLFGRYPFGGPL